MKRACVPVFNAFTADNRVLRTCRFLLASGFEVHVLAAAGADLPEYEDLDGINVHRLRWSAATPKTYWAGVNVTALRSLGAYVAGCAAWVRKHRPDVIHYNDWNTLAIGPLSGVRHRSVYDMHELFQDLDYLKFSMPVKRAIAAIDRAGLRRAEAVICVSKPIQRELQTLTRRPVYVVRNIPESHDASAGVPALVEHFHDGRKHLVFLGALTAGTGALYMLELLSHLPQEFVLDCFSGRSGKNAFFEQELNRLGIANRVNVFDLIPHKELCATIRHAYAGVSIIVPSSRKLDYALPNKLFEYLMADLPVITSNTQAQGELIGELGLGLVADLGDAPGTARKLMSWQRPSVTRGDLEKHGLTWEQEQGKLRDVYRDLGLV